ncbi:MAG: nucleotide sugar dehydrogenase [Campylobacterota bacterium]|nr:nucleotide sugar dehydrogenase [Campylobacterota bacterium]
MKTKIAIIGLGYVGLPLAVEFGKKYETIGYDLLPQRVDELNQGVDKTLEVQEHYLQEVLKNHTLSFTADIEEIASCNVYIVSVPTPIDSHKQPDLTPLLKASAAISNILKKDDIVIYESTVFPGATEEQCVPILEKGSHLKYNRDFFCGYSPERINPGDKQHTVTQILKVTSGSTPEIGKRVDELYQSIIVAGTHLAPSIKVAEAAKVIENSQRDINIAFMNELAIIFNKLNIDTSDVLAAAATKWNFIPFQPGLVGGHCIGVDPYYLTQKAQDVGYDPKIILAGRTLNDNMGVYIASQIIKLMIKKSIPVNESQVLILGITFKENCPDIRNSHVIDVINELQEFGCNTDVYDPWAESSEVKEEYGVTLIDNPQFQEYHSIVLAVAHEEFKTLELNKQERQVIYDIKSFLPRDIVDARL